MVSLLQKLFWTDPALEFPLIPEVKDRYLWLEEYFESNAKMITSDRYFILQGSIK